MVEGEFANYFETTNALQKIKEKGLFTVNEQGFLKPANNCEYFVELVENELPYTMRKRAVELAAKLAVKELYRQENEVEVIKMMKITRLPCILETAEKISWCFR